MRLNLLILSLLLLAMLSLPTLPVHAQETTVLSVNDPSGDDKGPGYYGYPANDVFQPGVFDLVKLEVATTDTSVLFKVYVSNLGDNPWGGPNGFCLQFVQIYVQTTMTGVPARTDTLGVNFMLRPDYAWHFAIMLAPGWDTAPVPTGQKAAIYYANGTVLVQNDTYFKVYADENESVIVAEINKTLIPDIDNIASWKIVVALTSFDGFGPMRVRPVGVTGGEWVINGTAYAANITGENVTLKLAQAIGMGIDPRVMDLLVYSPDYPDGINETLQYEWLDSYNPELGLPAFVPSLPMMVKNVTVTVTETTTYTTTVTHTTTQTQVNTVTVTETTTQTVTQTKTSWGTVGGVGIILLIIGIAIGYLGKK